MEAPANTAKNAVHHSLARISSPFPACLILVFGCLALYAQTLDFDFVYFDDNLNLLLNPHHGSPSLAGLRWMFTESGTMLRYLPLSWLLWSFVHAWTGLDALGYHTANLVLHAAGSVLLLLVARRTLALALGNPDGPAEAAWRNFSALAAAGLWAWHPLRVELVAWSSGLLYLHACFWLLLAIWCQLKAVEGFRNNGRWDAWLWISLGCQLASLLSYPLILCFPAIPFLLVLWLVPGDRRTRGRWRGCLASLALSGALGVIAVLIRLALAPPSKAPSGLADFPVHMRLLQACYVFAHGLWTTFIPSDLSPVRADLVGLSLTGPRFLAGLGTTVAVLLGSWLLGRRWRAIWWLCLAYVALQFPFLGFFEHPHVPCDRYTHLPGLVLACAVALGLACLKRVGTRMVAITATGLLMLLLSGLTREQTPHWRNSDTLLTHIVNHLADYPQVRAGYQEYHLDTLAIEGRGQTKISELSRHLFTMSNAAVAEKRFWDCEQLLRKAVSFSPAMGTARYNLAQLLAARNEAREAAAHYLVLKARGEPPADKLLILLDRVMESAQRSGDEPLSKALMAEKHRCNAKAAQQPIS